MSKIDKYIGYNVFVGIVIVLFVLVGLFIFFDFVDEVDDIGKQNYGLWQAILFVSLQIPQHIYELFPTSVLLGSLLGLGAMANNSELTVIRASGVSILRIARAVLQVCLPLTLIVMIIGETLAPQGEQYAYTMRSTAQADKEYISFQSRYGFWARDGNNFINIRTIQHDGGFGAITLYQLDEALRLKSLTLAQSAYYEQGMWQLRNVHKDIVEADQVRSEVSDKLAWNAVLNPNLIKSVIVSPEKLSIFGLYTYIQYMRESGQREEPYQLAFWQRITYPLISIAMIFIAIPFVFGSLRTVAIGQRILVGSLIGIGFHILNQTTGNIGLVYNMNIIASALFSPILFVFIAVILMRRLI
ncbi:LPS export ABC transporter permease LptG [Beggiatoa leptomitoformis]|uniref:LPS export ABC transporter permease LptG n=1 Tax=Beggiatoa leptomitoformis TaxID=288004 RepID=A0A2N9YG91_9GAMM|nr:LPS export ABC transporter permease LptG [Beggiatoa leptomitoformis]ALG68177.1 LPS export ABC transporter permease LptG [Beggiatoa leptomitoformis]AUI69520.1 LPS export ABC transporter permease LptG [Beggiatoa leptomitoformis]